MPTPSRNAIYDATIRRMTACALEEAENRFAVEHAQDTEQQLADYLRKYADELGHTPWPREIPGGVTIQTRFGSWEAAVAEALDTGQLSWAAVDVLSAEPPERDNPLLNHPKCLVTPHVAWCPKETRQRLLQIAGEIFFCFLKGDPQNQVN